MEEVVYVCLLSSFERSYFLLSSFKISYCYSDTFWYFYFLADNVWGCNTTPWSPAGTSAHGGKLLIINILSALSNKPFWDSLADWHKLLLAPRCTWVSRPAWHRSSVRGPLSSGDHGALTDHSPGHQHRLHPALLHRLQLALLAWGRDQNIARLVFTFLNSTSKTQSHCDTQQRIEINFTCTWGSLKQDNKTGKNRSKKFEKSSFCSFCRMTIHLNWQLLTVFIFIRMVTEGNV